MPLSQEGRVLVHGDPAGRNVLQTSSGLVLLDPPGALTALREADVAQICSQVGGVSDLVDMIDVACDQDSTLDPSAIAGFAGLNVLLLSGYVLAGHRHPDAEQFYNTSDPRTAARRCLNLAEELLAESEPSS